MTRDTVDLRRYAMGEIHFIRAAMERAVRFDAVPGVGLMAMGTTALITAALVRPAHPFWLWGWLAEAAVAFCVGLTTMVLKARRAGLALSSRSGQSFVFSFLPPLALALVLTTALTQADATHLLPGVWMAIYGLAAVTGGAFSVRTVSMMGAVFMGCGMVALFLPWRLASVLMGATFGALHLLFGAVIAWRHGG